MNTNKKNLAVVNDGPAQASVDIVETTDPNELAEHLLSYGEMGNIYRWRDEWYQFDDLCYRDMTTEALDVNIRNHLRSLWTFKRKNGGEKASENGKPQLVPIRPTTRLVAEVRAALPALDLLLDRRKDQPFYIDGKPAKELIVCNNGILNLATMELEPLTPQLFSTCALPFSYDPTKPEPDAWLSFLGQLWPDDPCSIFTLQEWFGYCLTPWTSLQKMLLIVGPRRSGKGTIARTLNALLGQQNVCGPTLGSMAGSFGLQPLLDKLLAVLSDARLSGRTDHATVIENLLRISGEDFVTIDRKHKTQIECKLPTRVMMLTNELPRLADTSGALASRFLTLKLTESFYGREDDKLTEKLLEEMPEILCWALRGRKRLRDRGHFVQPDSGAEAVQEMADLASPVGAFVREECEVKSGVSVDVDALWRAWLQWCESIGRDHVGTKPTFSRDLSTLVPGIKTRQVREMGGRLRRFEGIRLT